MRDGVAGGIRPGAAHGRVPWFRVGRTRRRRGPAAAYGRPHATAAPGGGRRVPLVGSLVRVSPQRVGAATSR
ncbi:Uncharacterised protein [Amycolatopsis camponoti]|uniref:Uncharacterized protein n=1 Tax=Amycolatopsis camponoti TaxID=2606593 RepID=A0A6I8LE45_9PSEU|nr:Uncharacterised protein [Amycolatopsis camponoti]